MCTQDSEVNTLTAIETRFLGYSETSGMARKGGFGDAAAPSFLFRLDASVGLSEKDPLEVGAGGDDS